MSRIALILDELYEAEAGSLPAGAWTELELVRKLADDRDAEAPLGERAGVGCRAVCDREPFSVIRDLDDEPVGMELVHDLHGALAPVAISVPHGVRAGLGHGELEIAQRLL